jgi:ZIP family zinc transporter
MLAIRVLAGGQREDDQSSLVVTILTNVLIDGVLIGLSAALGYCTGLLFAISLAPELALLGVTAADALIDQWPAGRLISTAVGIGGGITAAGALGWLTAQATPALATAVLGLGASGIIYLITEEVLREAHETDTGPWEVVMLFGCFLPFFLTGIATG